MLIHKVYLILILITLTGCAAGASATRTPSPTSTGDPIQNLADEFKSMRAIEGHFDGGPWNDAVDKWMGRKHQLMIELGDKLGSGAFTQSQIIDFLGNPDAIAQQGDELYALIRSRSGSERSDSSSLQFLIYHWRGEHDFLYFASQNEAILNSGWWYTGE